jgi:hypothetical protein
VDLQLGLGHLDEFGFGLGGLAHGSGVLPRRVLDLTRFFTTKWYPPRLKAS